MFQEPHNLCESVCQDFVYDDQVSQGNIFDFCTQRTDREGQPSELYLEWSDYVVDLEWSDYVVNFGMWGPWGV